MLLLYFLYVQLNHIQTTSFLDVNTIDTHEGINDSLAAVCDNRIAHRLGDYFDTHTRLNADAVAILCVFGCNNETCHNLDLS